MMSPLFPVGSKPRRVREDVKGSINIVVSNTIAGYFLPPFLARFTRAFPNIKINLSEADRASIEEGLITNGFDLAVMLTSNILNHEDLTHDTLWKSRRRAWVDAHHKFLKKPTVTLQDIAQEPYIMLTVDEASNTAQRYWNRTPHKPNTIFRTASIEAVRSLVANGLGISILSDMVHRPWSLEGRRVEVIEVSDEIPTMDVGMAWHQPKIHSEAIKAFVEFRHLGMATGHSHSFIGNENRVRP